MACCSDAKYGAHTAAAGGEAAAAAAAQQLSAMALSDKIPQQQQVRTLT
jgi:hypothetical protein